MLKLSILAATNRQPAWIEDGYRDYAKRLRGRCTLTAKAVPLAARPAGGPIERAVAAEGAAELAAKLAGWMQTGAPVAFLIGGPDGLAPDCVARAHEHWALSRLTLPHGLVKVLVAEALYRAWSVLERHPYHRA
jgi:23S rRNA (pseudouridine1915-N3)-methyltransferase